MSEKEIQNAVSARRAEFAPGTSDSVIRDRVVRDMMFADKQRKAAADREKFESRFPNWID